MSNGFSAIGSQEIVEGDIASISVIATGAPMSEEEVDSVKSAIIDKALNTIRNDFQIILSNLKATTYPNLSYVIINNKVTNVDTPVTPTTTTTTVVDFTYTTVTS